MNIDSALWMIDNEISNFRGGGQIKMQAGLTLPGARRGDSTRPGREVGREAEGRWDKLVAKDCSDDGGCLEDVNNDRTDSGRTRGPACSRRQFE